MSASNAPRKGPIQSAFDRTGDFMVKGLRLWRILRSRRARRIHSHRQRMSQREDALQKRREDWAARQRRRKTRKPRRVRSARSLMRLERLRQFHRQTPPGRLLALGLAPAAVVSLVVVGLFVFSPTKPRLQPAPVSKAPGPQNLRELQNETARLLTDNRLDEAQKNLEALDKLAPDTVIVLSHHGAMHMLRKDYPAARTAFAKALEVKPDSYVTRYNLAEVEFLTKNYPEAERLFRQMHEVNRGDEIILFRLALCAIFQNSGERFDRYLKEFPPEGRSPARQYAAAARLLQDRKTGEATRLIQQARIIFGDQTIFYDTTFREMGLVK